MDLSDVIPVEFDELTVVFLMRGPEPRPELSDEDLDRRRPPLVDRRRQGLVPLHPTPVAQRLAREAMG